MGTEGAFLELLTNRLTQFLTPSKDVNSLRGSRVQGLVLFISSTATAIARPTCQQQKMAKIDQNKKFAHRPSGSHHYSLSSFPLHLATWDSIAKGVHDIQVHNRSTPP